MIPVGRVEVLTDTVIFNGADKQSGVVGRLDAGTSYKVYHVKDNEQGTFLNVGSRGYVLNDVKVDYVSSDQIGSGGKEGLFSLNNIITVALIYVIGKWLLGGFDWIRKKVL